MPAALAVAGTSLQLQLTQTLVPYCNYQQESGSEFENLCHANRSQMSPVLSMKEVGQTPLSQNSSKWTIFFFLLQQKTNSWGRGDSSRKEGSSSWMQKTELHPEFSFTICISFELYVNSSHRSLLNSSSLSQQIENTGILEVTSFPTGAPFAMFGKSAKSCLVRIRGWDVLH